jgi:hypothetical protein
VDDRPKSQTSTATPAEPGELLMSLEFPTGLRRPALHETFFPMANNVLLSARRSPNTRSRMSPTPDARFLTRTSRTGRTSTGALQFAPTCGSLGAVGCPLSGATKHAGFPRVTLALPGLHGALPMAVVPQKPDPFSAGRLCSATGQIRTHAPPRTRRNRIARGANPASRLSAGRLAHVAGCSFSERPGGSFRGKFRKASGKLVELQAITAG